MTIAVDMGRKATKQNKKKSSLETSIHRQKDHVENSPYDVTLQLVRRSPKCGSRQVFGCHKTDVK